MEAQIKESFVENMAVFGFQGIRESDLVILKLEGKKSANGSIILLLINSADKMPVGLVKIPRNPKCFAHLESECRCIVKLNEQIEDEDVVRVIPGGCIVKDIGMRKVIIQEACQGVPMVRSLDPGNTGFTGMLFRNVFDWALKFHGAISEDVLLGESHARKYLIDPVEWLKANKPDIYSKLSENSRTHLEGLPLYAEGRKVRLMHQHGDFNMYNLLSVEDAAKEFSVIDWEDYKDLALPIHDINHFFVTGANLLKKQGVVDSVANLLVKEGWYRDLYAEVVQSYVNDQVFDEELFYRLSPLYFVEMIRHISSDSRQEEHTHEVWVNLCNLYVESFF